MIEKDQNEVIRRLNLRVLELEREAVVLETELKKL